MLDAPDNHLGGAYAVVHLLTGETSAALAHCGDKCWRLLSSETGAWRVDRLNRSAANVSWHNAGSASSFYGNCIA